MVKMWTVLLFVAALVAWPDSSQGQPVHLTSHDGWSFYKILTSGQMTNANVKATCEAAGMRYPCHYSGRDGCTHYWTSGCIGYTAYHINCRTHAVLSEILCGTTGGHGGYGSYCQPLDDTFVYMPDWQSDDSALGVDYQTHSYALHGADYNNKFALCASQTVYLTTHDGWSFYKIPVSGPMTNANVKATCEAAGMRYPCVWSGTAQCNTFWRSDCIAYDDAGTSCRTQEVLSANLCGTTDSRDCQPLDDTFVYSPGWRSDNSAWGVDYQTHTHELRGADYNNMYALCADINDINECNTSPCVHGTCTDDIGGYTCTCQNGWEGTNCDRNIDECASDPCQNGGICQDGVNSYTCSCLTGFHGDQCESGQGQDQAVYLTTHDGWSFFKIPVSGQMTNANVKATCEAAGMSYPCHYSGGNGCAPHSWTSDCIVYDDAGAGCVTHWVLSANLCGDSDAKHCQPLDETFVYIPNWRSDDSACGVVQDTLWCAYGANYHNMYAVCAAPTCAKCVHGTCTDANGGYTCTCENGWEGTNCDQDINECNNSPCAHGSSIDAIGGYTCTCQNGWEGTNCDQNINECNTSPCVHGTCTDDIGGYTCTCENGWEGTNCELNHDDCASSPCVHGACQDDVASYTCCCESGWEGTNCDQDIDDCASSPCIHGTCSDGYKSYTCSCENGWEGTNCDQDIDDCAPSPCVHGICTDDYMTYICSCENGWTGTNCDQEIDDCASSPCIHGTCTDDYMNYTCSCENGWTGTNCDQVDPDECASNPCWLGGTCLDHVDGYSCVCPKDSTGKNCETGVYSGECYHFSSTALTHLEATETCSANSGRMVDVRDEQQQRFLVDRIGASTSGYYVCQSALKPCEPNVCQNGGICTSCFNETTTFCECADGFEGKFCEIDIDDCASNPCQNGGTCQDGVNSYRCRCPTGSIGANCDSAIDWCQFTHCPFSWTCQAAASSFQCVNPYPVVREFRYQCSSASCPDGMYCTEEGAASFSCTVE
ncbi:uncharacterized protein LOC144865499 isoform X1 [Branchiostoma floridae x Branchiostoma japonicum]